MNIVGKREKNEAPFRWSEGKASLISENGWGARVLLLSDGTMLAGYETESGIRTCRSHDGGRSWQEDVPATFCPERSCANINFFENEGRVYLAHRAIGPEADGFYTSLRVSVSENGGRSWQPHSVIAEYREADGGFRGVWEPYLGLRNGKLTCLYANDSTSVTKWQNIESLTWNGEAWTERTVISCGEAHRSRDGMPVWIPLKDGGYALAIESSHRNDEGYPFVIQLSISPDGIRWSEPRDVYLPTTASSKAGAPGIAELPGGRLAISFQTDEDASVKGDSTSVMKTIVSDGTPYSALNPENFSASDNVFGTPDGKRSVWTGIAYADGILYAAGGTPAGAEMKAVRVTFSKPIV